MLRWFRGDLHIHTVLSACAELSMGPKAIVATAIDKGLDFIAITDHNSSTNVGAVMEAAGSSLTVFAGIEVSTREEIHMIALFPDVETAMDFQSFIYGHLLEGSYDGSWLGSQIICDAQENILGEDDHLLAMPAQVPYPAVIQQVVQRGGLIYPAHIDRRSNGILRVLGFMPGNLPFNIVEVSKNVDPATAEQQYGHNGSLTVITASDAHDIGHIGQAPSYFRMAEPTFAELCLAMTRQQERQARPLPPTT